MPKASKIFISAVLVLLIMEVTSYTMYSVSPDYKVSLQKSYNELGHAYFSEKGLSTGWNYLNIYANAEVSLIDQHRAAGFLEGYTTYKQIYFAYKNFMASFIGGPRLSVKTE